MLLRRVWTLLLATLLLNMALSGQSSGPSDPYQTLGLRRSADDSDIKKQYKVLARKWHPDKNPNNPAAEEKFVQIQKAYETLADPDKRRMFDQWGTADPKEAMEAEHRAQRQGRFKGGGQGGGSRYMGQRGNAWDSHMQGGNLFFFGGTGQRFSAEGAQVDPIASETQSITGSNFERKVLQSDRAWLLQLYADGSPECRRMAPVWELASRQHEGLVHFGRVDVSVQYKLALTMAEYPLFGLQGPTFRGGLPAFVAFPPMCRSLRCLVRFRGDLKSDLPEFLADRVLSLPPVPYLTHQKQVDTFLADRSNTVHVLSFGQRGATGTVSTAALQFAAFRVGNPGVRIAQVEYSAGDVATWKAALDVHRAPAVVVVPEYGAPVVQYSPSWTKVQDFIQAHQLQPIPELSKAALAASTNPETSPCRRMFLRGTWHASRQQACALLLTTGNIWNRALRDVLYKAKDQWSKELAGHNGDLAVDAAWLDTQSQGPVCRFILKGERDVESFCGPRAQRPALVLFWAGQSGVLVSRWLAGNLAEAAAESTSTSSSELSDWVVQTAIENASDLSETTGAYEALGSTVPGLLATSAEERAGHLSVSERLQQWQRWSWHQAHDLWYILGADNLTVPVGGALFLLVIFSPLLLGLSPSKASRKIRPAQSLVKKSSVDTADGMVHPWTLTKERLDAVATDSNSPTRFFLVVMVSSSKEQDTFNDSGGNNSSRVGAGSAVQPHYSCYSRLATRFRYELMLRFCRVFLEEQASWSCLAKEAGRQDEALSGHAVLIWHPSRRKFAWLGAFSEASLRGFETVNDGVAQVAAQIDRVLDGTYTEWFERDMPALT